MKKLFLIAMLLSLLTAGCNLPSGRLALPEAAGLTAWMDQPMDGSRFPPGPVEVVIHAYDPSGIRRVEFSVDGTVLAALDKLETEKLLSVVKTTWSPAAPGAYTLGVRALNNAGAWSGYARAVVNIGGVTASPPATATPAAALTPKATSTAAVTLTPETSATPTASATPAGVVFKPAPLPASVSYGSCQPNTIEFKLALENYSRVSSVVVFYRAADASTGEHPEWQSDAMNPLGGGQYLRAVPVDSVPDSRKYNPARLEYQFVAVDAAGQVAARSPFYANVSITPCAQVKPTVKPTANPNASPTP